MNLLSHNWPSVPDEARSVNKFDNAKVEQLIHGLSNNDSTVRFPKITPPDGPN